jgi:hypothetical protein
MTFLLLAVLLQSPVDSVPAASETTLSVGVSESANLGEQVMAPLAEVRFNSPSDQPVRLELQGWMASAQKTFSGQGWIGSAGAEMAIFPLRLVNPVVGGYYRYRDTGAGAKELVWLMGGVLMTFDALEWKVGGRFELPLNDNAIITSNRETAFENRFRVRVGQRATLEIAPEFIHFYQQGDSRWGYDVHISIGWRLRSAGLR